MSKLTMALLVGLMTAVPAGAQISYGGSPLSARRALRDACPTCELAPVDVSQLAAEDALRGSGEPFRWGQPIGVELTLENSGVWEELEDGGRVWRLRLESAGAYSIMVTFARFQLPRGADLFLYNDDKSVVRGAYTYLSNRDDGLFAIQPTPGDAVTLEYFEPADVDAPGELWIDSVVHDYVGIETRSGGPGASAACQVDVECQGGINDLVGSVVLITTPTGNCCSGVLINNTSNDGAPYILTARHCGNLVNAVFRFNFNRPSCGSGVPATNDTVSGSIRLIEESDVAPGRDFQVVWLTAQIPASYGVKFAGWDRSDTPPTSTATIHHPRGDYMKVSIDADAPTKTAFEWNIGSWESGSTETGSSGSPLFSQDKKVIGHLRAGASTCALPDNDFYTRFGNVWDKLGVLLDPLGTGAMDLDLYDPSLSPPPTTFNVTGIVPTQTPVLVPGTGKTVQLLGTGFRNTTTVRLNGAPLSAQRWRRMSDQRIAVDMPQLPLGPQTLTVEEGGASMSVPLDVVNPPAPVHQAGNGDCGQLGGNIVSTFGGVQLTYADQPGHVQLCYWSMSDLPSVHPMVMFDLGNQFTQLYFCSVVTIPSQGFFQENLSISSALSGMTIYSQTWCMSCGLPGRVSNLQESFVF
jgi:hypothetical protein